MFESNRTVAAVGRVAAIFLAAIIFAAVLPSGGFAATQKGTKPSTNQEASPKQIQELITLLADPKVRNWLEEQSKAEAASERAATEEPVSQVLASRLAGIREHIVALAGTVPDLPNQYERGHDLVSADLGKHGRTKALLLLAVFVGLGAGVEWLFRKATQRARAHLDAALRKRSRSACISSRCVLRLRSVWWWRLGSAASAHSLRSTGHRCCASSCLACSSPFLSRGSRMSSATFCSHRITSGSASFRWIRRPHVFGSVGWLCLSAGLPSVGLLSGSGSLSATRWRHASWSPMCSDSCCSRLRWTRFGAGPSRSTKAAKRCCPSRVVSDGAQPTRRCRSASCC